MILFWGFWRIGDANGWEEFCFEFQQVSRGQGWEGVDFAMNARGVSRRLPLEQKWSESQGHVDKDRGRG